jgi:class 3 adenylate cyclase/tetratricopeptide (TPR) repeat protein
MTSGAATVTILFTDLVASTELMQRVGDESAQRLFEAHHKLLVDALRETGGEELQWMGDGLMASFNSAADAVRCAIAMQQAARRTIAGHRLAVRAGLNAGEILRQKLGSGYFGTPVVVASRLCALAHAGQILCTNVVAGLLAGRQAFQFRDTGQHSLKGVATPVGVAEVLYQRDDPAAMLARTPFVGRGTELAKLEEGLDQAKAGHGGLAMLIGEPGIGKTRAAEEFAERARTFGAAVVRGRCFEGEATPPYGPFSEALAEYARTAEVDGLRADLGYGAAPVARLVPPMRERLPDIPEPVALSPDEERFRLFDAVSQFLIAASVRAPVVVMLDDLHWADKGTIAMLLHLARFIPKSRILVLGAYRDVELDRQHPLADALGSLRREPGYKRIVLKGLIEEEVGTLLESIAEQEVDRALVHAISAETEGNPFFIREVLLHLVEEKKIFRQDGHWTSKLTVAEMGIPEGVREVIGRRLSRLSAAANRLLASASGFNGVFRFDVALAVADLEEREALRALDEALDAQVLKAAGAVDSYDFTHALIRHTLYSELNPSRQVRLHRHIAEAMERTWGAKAIERAAEIAYQYHRSAAIPGAERGAEYAIAAAGAAESTYAHEDVVTFLRIALDLLPKGDRRRPGVLGRLGLALAWTLNPDEALQLAKRAGDLIFETEGDDAAADYLAPVTTALADAGFFRQSWELAACGLRHIGDRRDITWVSLTMFDIFREEFENPNDPGIPVDSQRRRDVALALDRVPKDQVLASWMSFFVRFESREELDPNDPGHLLFYAGEYGRCLPIWENLAPVWEREGKLANAVLGWSQVSRAHNALGDLTEARRAHAKGAALALRLTGSPPQLLMLVGASDELCLAVDEGWEEFLAEFGALAQQRTEENNWALGTLRACMGRANAHLGRSENALTLLTAVLSALERAPGWAANYARMAADAASTLWLLNRSDHVEVIERNIREKVVKPDFRYPMQDGRLSLARLCALQGRYDEAEDWFAKSRAVLEEQGARPLRAIADYDEALMYVRRGSPGDRDRARPLLDAAMHQFEEIGMTGWLKRAKRLRQEPDKRD